MIKIKGITKSACNDIKMMFGAEVIEEMEYYPFIDAHVVTLHPDVSITCHKDALIFNYRGVTYGIYNNQFEEVVFR